MKYLTRTLFFFDADTATGGGNDGGAPAAPAAPAAATLIADTPAQTQSSSAGYFDQNGAFVEGWVDKLPEDFISPDEREAFKTHAGKYKSPLDVVKSDFHKEKMLGKRGTFVPGENATPEEVAAFRKATGVPEAADKYNLKPAQLPEGLAWDDALAKPYAEIAHRHNIPEKAMQEIVAAHLQTEQSRMQAISGMVEKDLASGRAELKQAFGEKFNEKIAMAQQAAKTVGVDPLSRGFMDPAVVQGFVRLAEMISEDKIALGGDGKSLQGGMNRAKDIMTNAQNPYHAKYQAGDEDTVAMVRSLMQQG